ncbi:unnamed protein product, partial [Ilex paraguariensis]
MGTRTSFVTEYSRSLFYPSGEATMSYLSHLLHHPTSEYPFQEIYIRDYEKENITHMIEAVANDIKDTDRARESVQRSSNIILIKTFREIEGKYIEYLSVLSEKKIVPVGPLVQEPLVEDESTEIMEWLNKKDRFST